jgi:hypothetical protein
MYFILAQKSDPIARKQRLRKRRDGQQDSDKVLAVSILFLWPIHKYMYSIYLVLFDYHSPYLQVNCLVCSLLTTALKKL